MCDLESLNHTSYSNIRRNIPPLHILILIGVVDSRRILLNKSHNMDIANLEPGLYEASWIGLVLNPQTHCFQLTFVIYHDQVNSRSGKVGKVTRTVSLDSAHDGWVGDFASTAGLCYCKDQPRQCLPGSIDIDCEVSLESSPDCPYKACIRRIHFEDASYEIPRD